MSIFSRLIKTRPYLVWHYNEPDVKVVVFRNIFHDFIYIYDELHENETSYDESFHVAIDRTIY